MAAMNKSPKLLDLPNEVLIRIGHCLIYEQADIHIESSGGSAPKFSYKLCSEQAAKFSKAYMRSQKREAESPLIAYLHDISFGSTCKKLYDVYKDTESVRVKQLRGCIFDQTTFEKFNTSIETNVGNAKPFSRVQLILSSFEISFLKRLPSTYLWKVGRLEIFLLEPDGPDRFAEIRKLLPEGFLKQVKEPVNRLYSTGMAIAWESWLTADSFDKELAIPTPRFHRQCERRMLEGRAWRSEGRAGRSKLQVRFSKQQARRAFMNPAKTSNGGCDASAALAKEPRYI